MKKNKISKVTGLGFATRDIGAKSEEEQGIIEFTVIRNDRFTNLKNLVIMIIIKNYEKYEAID